MSTSREHGSDENELRVVLLGSTGGGKSATGNTVLGKREFKSKYSAQSVTSFCQLGYADRFGKHIRIVDTPGFFDTRADCDHFLKEIAKCVFVSSPGPHVFVVVLQPGRFTSEDSETIKQIEKMFGEAIMRHVVAVFTRKDELERNDMSVDEFIQDSPETLKHFIKKVGSRYFAINNVCSENEKENESKLFVEKIKDIVRLNDGNHYTDQIFEEAEKSLNQEVLKRRHAIEDEMLKKMQAIRTDLEDRGIYTDEEYENRTSELRQEMERRLLNIRKDLLSEIGMGISDGAKQLLKGCITSFLGLFKIAVVTVTGVPRLLHEGVSRCTIM